ncbi:MAG: hypothetical protein JEZ00_21320 [Anaerolineaceae bacterium]|nr:hypothetical protein [Anaerolineaceae bacterium]
MKDQEILFKRLKELKNYWVQTSLEGLDEKADLIWSDYEDEYRYLQNNLSSDESKQAYEKVLDEVIRGVIHSILVILDGGDEVTDKLNIALINEDTKKSLKEGIALHEEFFSYLLDSE